MKRARLVLIFVLGIFLFQRIHGFAFIVTDPWTLVKMVKKFSAEVAQWRKQLQHWGKLQESWVQELKHFDAMRKQWEKENKLFEKLMGAAETNNLIWAQFLAAVGSEFKWDELRLKEILEILEKAGFGQAAGSDPYQGLFTVGRKVADVFLQIRNWDEVKKSSKYQNNAEYQKYVDRLIEDQKKMLDDLDNKIKVIAKLNNLVPEREKKFLEIQKRFEEYSQASPINLTKLWILNSEVSMELCREMFHLVALDRMETENFLLDELRSLNESKLEDKFSENSKEKDKEVAVNVLTGKKGGGK